MGKPPLSVRDNLTARREGQHQEGRRQLNARVSVFGFLIYQSVSQQSPSDTARHGTCACAAPHDAYRLHFLNYEPKKTPPPLRVHQVFIYRNEKIKHNE